MTSTRTALLASVLLLSACTTTRVAQPDTVQARTFLRAAADETVTVRLAGGEAARARSLRVEADSTSWIDPSSRTVRQVATAEVVSVDRIDRMRGAKRGAITAAAMVGGVATVAAYALQDPDDCTATIVTSCGPGSRVALSVAFGSAMGFLGAFPGAGVGAIVGETDRLTLTLPSPPQRVTEAGWAPGPPVAR